MQIVEVAVPLTLFECYSYLSDDILKQGDIVNVNFNGKTLYALVVKDSVEYKEENNIQKIKYKSIIKKCEYSLTKNIVEFIKWFSDYNLIPTGLVFKNFFSIKFLDKTTKSVNTYKYIENDKVKKITKTQENIYNFLQNNKNNFYSYNELKEFSSLNVLKTLVKNGLVEEKANEVDKYNYNIELDKILLNTLTDEQGKVYNNILNFNDNKPILLEGITGSGKTEIYFHLFEYYLKSDNKSQILFLLPEIALTSQFIMRFKTQFNCKNVAVWHSNISESEKNSIWQKVFNNEIKVVIGARSSLFLPFKNLKLIIVDEEHDASYKQTENGCYNARDMAIVRAKIEKAKIVLGTATPSMESIINAESGKYNYCLLESRYGKAVKPIVEIVDLKKDKLKSNCYLSKHLIQEMKIELDKNNQVLLFMNRRGYAPIAICKECGHRFLCKNCSCNLTVHMKKHKFVCHQCGYSVEQTDNCPTCGTKDSVTFFGPGVEKIEKEVLEYFPDVKIAIITSDTINNIQEITEIINKIQNKEIDIIIGTQMITKGYDFPYLTLVGILDADANLFGANFRATERTYQLLTQVVGRAGRRERLGKAIIQSYNPDNLILQSLCDGDKDKIIEFEKENRQLINLPPYGKLAMVIFSGKDEIKTYKKIKEFVTMFPPNNDDFEILGPTPTFLYKMNNDFRFKLLFKSKNNVNIQKMILKNIEKIKTEHISIKIDVNPYFII